MTCKNEGFQRTCHNGCTDNTTGCRHSPEPDSPHHTGYFETDDLDIKHHLGDTNNKCLYCPQEHLLKKAIFSSCFLIANFTVLALGEPTGSRYVSPWILGMCLENLLYHLSGFHGYNKSLQNRSSQKSTGVPRRVCTLTRFY